MKERTSSIIWGTILIAIGVIFLGNTLNLWAIDIFFKGWWTLFIIVPSVVGLLKEGTRTSSLLGLSIGVLLLLSTRNVIAWSMVGKMFVPILLVIIGVSIIFKPKFGLSYEEKKKLNKKGIPEYVAVFSGAEDRIKGQKFIGANCVSVFGGVELDLREAIFEEDVIIDCVSVFGSTDISLPDNVRVKVSGVPIFGGAENKAPQKVEDTAVTVNINYVCIFGGVDIK